ncbi:ABC transporter [Microbacterium capsulatum]|uniref:ABC transporter n=1 Tax=Microbacterium capsulatum TaxID=3041921 RepID=A0ABU0XGC7_9MICO|nr:ABC transporter [Microbacterium sp. ASV81]MDQ4214184.1 ABC transporter [Microbacterium sp. ASV81]
MSDHEVSKPAQAHDVDDVVDAAPADGTAAPAAEPDHAAAAADADHAAVAASANEGLAEAARAAEGAPAAESAAAQPSASAEKPVAPAEDPDVAAFAAAEAAFPGTFGGTFTPPAPLAAESHPLSPAETTVIGGTSALTPEAVAAETQVLAPATHLAPASAADAAPLPIFVQAPEAPRERGNRGAIFGIGLLAAVCFAVLYLGTALGVAALTGKADSTNIGTYALDQLRSAGLWVPVVVFFIGFWFLGAIINRGRWGFWVVFGIIVGAFAYAGHLLGAIGSVAFWTLGTAEIGTLVGDQLLAPLAIAAFVFGRELTIWFGAWAARTGARRTAQNEEAQREYERVLEAGPQLPQ